MLNEFRPPGVNLIADTVYNPAGDELGLVVRKRAATTLHYIVEMSHRPTQAHEEADVSIPLTQMQHIDLSVIAITTNNSLAPQL